MLPGDKQLQGYVKVETNPKNLEKQNKAFDV